MKNELKKKICELFDVSSDMVIDEVEVETLMLSNPHELVKLFHEYSSRFNELAYALYVGTKSYKVDR